MTCIVWPAFSQCPGFERLGTWRTHIQGAEDTQRGLRNSIKEAERMGCPVPPTARKLATRPLPKQPRGTIAELDINQQDRSDARNQV
jgi:hypothetical protein